MYVFINPKNICDYSTQNLVSVDLLAVYSKGG